MRTIVTTIEVDDEEKATIRLPTDLAPGPYRAVVALETREAETPPRRSVLDYLDSLPPGPRSAPTWEEIERRFQGERDGWDR
jgi:hypothetical protein